MVRIKIGHKHVYGKEMNKAIVDHFVDGHRPTPDNPLAPRDFNFPELSEDQKLKWKRTIRRRIKRGGFQAGHAYDGVDKDTFKSVASCTECAQTKEKEWCEKCEKVVLRF